MKKWIWICIAAALVIGLFAGVKAYRYWYDHKSPNFEGTLDVYVYPWMEPETVCDSIIASGQVRKPASLRRVFKDVETLEVGHYRIDSTCTSVYVTRMLHKGWQTPVNLTLSGAIRTPGVLARKIGAQMLADSADIASFIYSRDSLKTYGVDYKQVFTMVIPDTYQMMWTASVRDIFDRFAKERDAWWTPEWVDAAHAQGVQGQKPFVAPLLIGAQGCCDALWHGDVGLLGQLAYHLAHLVGQDNGCTVVTLRQSGLKHLRCTHRAIAIESLSQTFDVLFVDIDILLLEADETNGTARQLLELCWRDKFIAQCHLPVELQHLIEAR